MTATATRIDHYTRITSDIVRQLENGVHPWHQPWKVKHAAGGISRPLRSTGEPYHGINVVVLWLIAFENQYVSPLWELSNRRKSLADSSRKARREPASFTRTASRGRKPTRRSARRAASRSGGPGQGARGQEHAQPPRTHAGRRGRGEPLQEDRRPSGQDRGVSAGGLHPPAGDAAAAHFHRPRRHR